MPYWLTMLIISTLFAISVAGLTFMLLRSMFSGAAEYSSSYSEQVARQFEEVFMFVPPRQIARMGWAAAAIGFTAVFLLVGGFSSKTGLVAGLVLGLIVAIPALYSPKIILSFLKQRRLKKYLREFLLRSPGGGPF